MFQTRNHGMLYAEISGAKPAAFALLAAIALSALVWIFHSGFPKGDLLFVYPPLIGAAAYLGGRVAGYSASAVGIITAWVIIIQPTHPFALRLDTFTIIVLFAIVAVSVVEGVAGLRLAERASRQLAMIVRSSNDAIFSETPDGTITSWNAGAEALFGYTAQEIIGKPVFLLAPPERAAEVRDSLASLSRGERLENHETVRLRKDGTRIDVSLTISPLQDARGRVMGWAVIAHDIGERKRIADRAASLQHMAEALSRALSIQAVAEVCVDQGLIALGAKAGALTLISDDGRRLDMIRAVGYPPEFVERWHRAPLHTRPAVVDAIKTRAPQYMESREKLLKEFDDAALAPAILPDSGARVVIPLTRGRETLGILSFLFPAPREFTDADRAFIEMIARQCAQALDRARLYEREHRVAVTLQRALLPKNVPRVAGITMHAAYLPGASESDVGGDWYDVFRLPNGRIAVSVGDVTGRGLAAAVVMGQVRQAIRAAAFEGYGPPGVLERAGRIVEWTSGNPIMATALFGTFDPHHLTFTYAVAGHPAPIVAVPGRGAQVLQCSGALPLGHGDRNPPPPSNSIVLPPGALLVVYTDGLIEITRDVIAGEEDLLAAVAAECERPASDTAQGILTRVVQQRRPSDDIALVTLSVSPIAQQRLDLSLPAEPLSAREARQQFRRFAAASAIEDSVTRLFEIALGEAVSNAVEHAYGAARGMLEVRVWHDGSLLTAEVEDHGQWIAERTDQRGYGLRLMRALLDHVDISRGQSGTTVTLSTSLAPPSRTVPADPSIPYGNGPSAGPARPEGPGPEIPRSPRNGFAK